MSKLAERTNFRQIEVAQASLGAVGARIPRCCMSVSVARRRIAMSMKRVQASEERRMALSATTTGKAKTCTVSCHSGAHLT